MKLSDLSSESGFVNHASLGQNQGKILYKDLEVTILSGQEACRDEDFLNLRREVYVAEKGLLSEENFIDDNDRKGFHVIIRLGALKKIIATTSFIDAADSNFSEHSGISRDKLRDCFYASRSITHPLFRNQGLLKLLLYVSLRQNRMAGKQYMLSYNESGDQPAAKVLKYSTIEDIAPRKIPYQENDDFYEVYPTFCEINAAMHNIYEKMAPEMQDYVRNSFFAEEAEALVKSLVQAFYANPFFQKAKAKEITRTQYIHMLSDKYQFVKWTTRLLGHAIAMSHDSDLRKHYVQHLSGEVDHEVLIERDLSHLGADLNYVKNGQNPGKEIQEFMAIQESLAGFHKDPVAFLAVPFTAEGITAFMPRSFIAELKACVEAWGYQNPQKALTFLASHIHTDGADDGHWNATKAIISKKVESEKQLQRMLNISRCIMSSFERAYASYTGIPSFFG